MQRSGKRRIDGWTSTRSGRSSGKGRYVTTREFQRRADRRGFTLRDATTVIEVGAVVEERPDQKPYAKATVAGTVERDVAGVTIRDELHIAVALGDDIVLLTGYWKNDRPSRKRGRQR